MFLYNYWTFSTKYCLDVPDSDILILMKSFKVSTAHLDLQSVFIFVAFVEDNATMSSIRYFENHALYFEYKRTMMVLYRSPEHICNLYGLSRAGY